MIPRESLKTKLKKISGVFNLDTVTNIPTDKDYVRKYYQANKIAYSLFHTFSDRIYMGVSRDGKFKKEDLLEAARLVEKYIAKLKAKNVLELATGRGATSAYLASKYRNVRFDGIDISEVQLDFAFQKAKKLKNYHPLKGDYHDLGNYKSNSFDIVFEIEAVCYSLEKEKVLKEVSRVLKRGGVFILFDGYSNKSKKELSKEERLCWQLTQKAMAVADFENYKDFRKKAKEAKFSLEDEEDVSEYIIPTLRRFEKLAHTFFKHPFLAKVVTEIFSKEFAYNTIAGYLMPEVITKKIGCYYITILRKFSSKSVT